MKIAYIKTQKSGASDDLLAALVAQLQAAGRQVAGVIKDHNYAPSHANGCDMKLRVLPQGPVIKITQDLGTGSDACRLDADALTQVVALVEAGAIAGSELFVLNKFGPEERLGRGFCAAIATAIEYGVPVLVGVSSASEAGLISFAGGQAEALDADLVHLHRWWSNARSEHQPLQT
ncbi:DUF2478 domain-containing protein [Pararhodobacter oceanensis]|uniref:3-dehydroquinate dehydratase n=1 Tax=Pararhodobacter oceanensis TaxID=2172121 RepID=A0A2T8HXW2_9RHOB|nr:DUF2478 domain-containing protein [Pararhodobacter oceanensis]PVH30268.1 3-dehydroquinate dehydratase [Pararhodobacter oceanensis]